MRPTNGKVRRAHSAIGRERRRTYDAARRVGIEPVELVRLAEARAGAAAVRDIDVRDFVQEAREEFADARNYLVWLAEQLDRGAPANLGLVETIRAKVTLALADTASAFQRTEEIRVLMDGWTRP